MRTDINELYLFISRTEVGTRYGSIQMEVHGFFPGAIVRRGRDWKCGEQDGKSFIPLLLVLPNFLVRY